MPYVLIVEDDADAAATLAEVMHMEGHEVQVADNGQHGLGLLNDRMPDLILLDVEMPAVDGPSMAKKMLIRNTGLERVPVVLLSGVAQLALIAQRVGTSYFLSKPYSYERLVGLVTHALNERRPMSPQILQD